MKTPKLRIKTIAIIGAVIIMLVLAVLAFSSQSPQAVIPNPTSTKFSISILYNNIPITLPFEIFIGQCNSTIVQEYQQHSPGIFPYATGFSNTSTAYAFYYPAFPNSVYCAITGGVDGYKLVSVNTTTSQIKADNNNLIINFN